MYKRIIKPVADFTIALVALFILSPLFIIVAIAIKLNSPGTVFFLQERLGKNGRVFKIIKFRSMTLGENKMQDGKLYKNDPRISRVGHFIRKTSIDELPQLVNILKGEMSFIGPRPPVTFYPKKYEEYTEFEKKRFLVKPGISGLAAIKQREIHEWDKNIPLDVEYVDNFSYKNDVYLFMKSLFVFFKTNNIYTKK